MVQVECALFLSVNRDVVRMTPGCENPPVRSGNLNCDHFLGVPYKPSIYAKDITGTCRRAKACREAPRPDETPVL